MFKHVVLAVVVTAAFAVPASAQTQHYVGTTTMAPVSGYDQIRSGRLDRAEKLLSQQIASHPDAPEVALNLAAVYVKTGRTNMAQTLYQRVLAMPEMAMDMPSGAVASSHAVARNGAAVAGARMAMR